MSSAEASASSAAATSKHVAAAAAAAEMHKLTFEIFGKVQGVFFRKHTAEHALKLSLVGYCANTKTGSVIGEAVGAKDNIAKFQHWLRHKGSPNSQIHDAAFTLADATDGKHAYKTFEIRR